MLRRFLRRHSKRSLLPVFQPLEPRQLLSGDIVELPVESRPVLSGGIESPFVVCFGTLRITGTSGDDRIVLSLGGTRGDITIITAPGYADGTEIHGTCSIEIDGGDGNDYIEILPRGVDLRETLHDAMHMTLRGGNGDDVLTGGDEHVTFDGGAGNDQIIGRSARDHYHLNQLDFSRAPAGATVRLDLGEIPEDGYGGHDTVTGVANVHGSDWDDIIYAGAQRGWIHGMGGNDLLVAHSYRGSSRLAMWAMTPSAEATPTTSSFPAQATIR